MEPNNSTVVVMIWALLSFNHRLCDEAETNIRRYAYVYKFDRNPSKDLIWSGIQLAEEIEKRPFNATLMFLMGEIESVF